MKKIIRIARVEILSLFYLPVAWLILIAFIIHTGVEFFASYRMLAGGEDQFFPVTMTLFYNQYSGLFTLLKSKLIYYIPLLTMGVISKEISSGSIKLLLSSPVKISEFILGKFLGVAGFCLSFIAVLTVYALIALFTVEHMDWGAVFAGLLGIYLMICTYAAIGVFMSSLTSYQAVAALTTLAVLFSLNNLCRLWQQYDFFRDITYNLTLSGRLDVFINGLITSRDVIYLLSMITTFLGLAIMRLVFNRQLMPFSKRLPRYILLVLVVMSISYISMRPKLIGYWDMTDAGLQTISKEGQALMKQVKEPITVTTYVNLLDDNYAYLKPQLRNADLLYIEPFRRFHRDMQTNYVYFYDSTPRSWKISSNYELPLPAIAEKAAKTEGKTLDYFLSPEEVKKEIDLGPVENRIVREFKMGDRRAMILTHYGGEPPTEKEMLVPIKMLLGSEPRILGFVEGHNEREINKHGFDLITADFYVRQSLSNNGFISKTISLKEDIPSDLTALIIADPKFDYTNEEMQKLLRYIDEGHNLIIFGEIHKKEVVDKLVAPLGLRFMDATLLTSNKTVDQNFVISKMLQYPDDTVTYKNDNTNYRAVFFPKEGGAFEKIANPRNFNISYCAVTDTSNMWIRPGILDLTDSARVEFNQKLGDKREVVPTFVKLTRRVNNRDQKIIVVGDADMLNGTRDELNFDVIHSMIRCVSNGEFPVKIENPKHKDIRINASRKDALTLRNICTIFTPSLLFVGGAVVLIRRKRK